MSWGVYWGSNWGGNGLLISNSPAAWAVSERQLWVTTGPSPSAVSTISPSDALNPASWRVTRSDTGADCIVIGVKAITPTVFELYTLEIFASNLVTHTVTGTLLDSAGSPFSVSQTFLGCTWAQVAQVQGGLVDFANPYYRQNGVDGTLKIGADGDYLKVSGADLLKKLVIRRLTTMPGDFFHLDPDAYGVGLRLKETPSISSMPALRAAIVAQLQQEPEFSQVGVRLSLDTRGLLTVLVQAILMETNQQVSVPITALPPNLVNL